MFGRVAVERIFDNPFQTRTVYTEIEELAASILKMKAARPETSGLIQVPPARILVAVEHFNKKPKNFDQGEAKFCTLNADWYGGVNSCLEQEPLAFVQLAAGHRRFRAFAHLALSPTLSQGEREEYGTFPVDILMLDNQQMADLAWEENAKRKDLTAIEEAEALAHAIESFGWTQAQIGERWGLSQSAVANKIRLLNLPEEARQAIRGGVISEKHGRALLSALGKGEHIYHEAAAEILPGPEVSEPAAEVATLLVNSEEMTNWNAARGGFQERTRIQCQACSRTLWQPGQNIDEPYHRAFRRQELVALCDACYKAGSGWQPPATAEAEAIVRRAIYQYSTRMDKVLWPLDRSFEASHSAERVKILPACDGCPAREQRNDKEWWCLNKSCYEQKQKLWQAEQEAEVLARLQRDYGHTCPIFSGYQGQDLRNDGVDREMVEQGVCVPGVCKRLRLKRSEWEDRYRLRPYADLPYYWNCDNGNSHTACQKKYLDSQESTDEKSAARLRAEMEAEHKRQAKEQIEAAKGRVSQALEARELKAWRKLVDSTVGYGKGDKLATVEECLERIAASILSSQLHELTWGSWDEPERLQVFHKKLSSRLAELGISQEMEAG